jgi:hypothetical protein
MTMGATRAQIIIIRGAEIAENKINWYLTVITIDYIDLKKNRSATFEFWGAKNPIAPPNSCVYDHDSNVLSCILIHLKTLLRHHFQKQFFSESIMA